MSARFRTLASAVLILLVAPVASSAELPSRAREPVIPNLRQLARKSGYIFFGTVKSVERITPMPANALPVVRITFHVDKGYLGVRSGQELLVQVVGKPPGQCLGIGHDIQGYGGAPSQARLGNLQGISMHIHGTVDANAPDGMD